MNKLLNYVFFATSLVLALSCTDKISDNNIKKNPREYTWTVDTLHYPGSMQTEMRSIWGSSPNDIYISGHNDQAYAKIWHFDGKNWKAVDLFADIKPSPIDIFKVYGYSSNRVWAVGDRITQRWDQNAHDTLLYYHLILRFDGSHWHEENITGDGYLLDVWLDSPNNVWATGKDGIIYHYDGSNWSSDSVKISSFKNWDFSIGTIKKYGSDLFLIGTKYNHNTGDEYSYFIKKNNYTWTVIDSFMVSSYNTKFGSSLYSTNSGRLLSYGFSGGVYEWNGNNWFKIYSSGSVIGLGGSDDNLFIADNNGRIFHYNGQDWVQLPQFDNTLVYQAIWADENEAFIIGYTQQGWPQNTVVWHGK